MTHPPRSLLTGPAASLVRRRWFWLAFVAVLAVLGATAGGSALAARGGLAPTAQESPAGGGAAGADAVTSSRSVSTQGNGNGANNGNGPGANSGNGNGNGNGNGPGTNNGNGNGNGNGSNNGNGNGPGTNNGNGNGNGNGTSNGNGNGETPAVTPPVVTLPGESPIVVDGDPAETPATPDPSGTPDPTEPPAVEPELTLPGETSPPPVETPAEPEPDEEPTAPVAEVVPAPAAVPVVAIGIAPGCVDGTAVLVQKAQNQDTKGVSVNFLANADFATSGSLALLTAPDALGRDQVTVTSTSGKAYVGAGSVSVRTYRAGQTLGGVTYPAVSETRKLAYDAFTCERPAVLTNVKTQLVNGQVHLAQYARNTGNTTLQVKFNATAHFAASVSFSLAPGEAKYFLVPTQSASVPSAVVSVNVVTNVQGSRISLNQNNRYDALSVATPN